MKVVFLAACLTWAVSCATDPSTGARIELDQVYELKDKTVALAVADYNKKIKHFAYKEWVILNTTGTATTTGNFVKITFSIKQTNCLSKDYRPDTCRHKRNGRVLHCVACFAYEKSEAEPAAKFVDCISSVSPSKTRANQQLQQCETVQKKIFESYEPGARTFLARQPPPDEYISLKQNAMSVFKNNS